MKTHKQKAALVFLLFLSSCIVEIPDVPVPETQDSDYLKNTVPIHQNGKSYIEGIYNFHSGNNEFGDKAVVKWSGNNLSIYTGKNYSYLIMQGGMLDSAILFQGYWRSPLGSETGLVKLQIKYEKGACELINGTLPNQIIFEGNYGSGNDAPSNPIVFEFDTALATSEKEFFIIGHRGGGRNIEKLPASENSLEMIEYAERIGCNAIEIDLKITKDGIPVLLHDDYLNSRVINEENFIGKVSDYTFSQLRSFCTLKNGGRIPTLREALQTVIDKTNIKLVWLDVKTSGIIKTVTQIQNEYLSIAQGAGRNLEIVIGLPEESTFNEFTQIENCQQYPSLCELSESFANRAGSIIWAPRWSQGLLNESTANQHSLGKRVFVWTIDQPELIKTFLREGDFDGILTNYPSIATYEYYVNQ